MRKFVFASLLVGLCFMPYESDAQFFKKIGNAIKSAVNSVANKADCWFSTGPCDGVFMSCKIKIDKGGGN